MPRPNDPRLHLLLAELARAEGDNETALAELRKAQSELARRNGDIWIAPEQYGDLSEVNYVGGNPFADRAIATANVIATPPATIFRP